MYSGIGIATQSNGQSGFFHLFLFRNLKVNRTHPKTSWLLLLLTSKLLTREMRGSDIVLNVNTGVDREWNQGVFNNTLLIAQFRDVFWAL